MTGRSRTVITRTLADWENPQGPILPYSITAVSDRIDINFDDGRAIWIELQLKGGVVKVHHYNPAEDEPLNVNITLEACVAFTDG